jgi:cobalt-precorrin 5A hydrolase
MGVDETMRAVAGIGCRKGVSAEEVEAAVARAVPLGRSLDALAIGEGKRAEAGIMAAAERLGLPIVLVGAEALAAAAPRALSRSARVEALLGLPSLAETAALAAAGPASRLLGPRLAVGRVACAVAVAE